MVQLKLSIYINIHINVNQNIYSCYQGYISIFCEHIKKILKTLYINYMFQFIQNSIKIRTSSCIQRQIINGFFIINIEELRGGQRYILF